MRGLYKGILPKQSKILKEIASLEAARRILAMTIIVGFVKQNDKSIWNYAESFGEKLMGVFPKFIYKVRTNEKLVALTFDDGPHPVFTNELLDLFKEKGIKATFFVTGKNIEKHNNIINRMIAEGHELGNHSYSHNNLIFKKKNKIKEEIQKTDSLLRELGVKGDIHFRPPFGRLLFAASAVLASLNKKVIMWNVPTKDFKENDPNVILKRIYKRIKPGSIIVLHDSGVERPGKRIDRIVTITVVKKLIDELLKKGYKFRTVSELIEY